MESRKFLGLTPARPGVEPVVRLFEPLLIDVRVDLRRRDVCVSEHFLNDAQVAAVVEQMRGKTVPECVR